MKSLKVIVSGGGTGGHIFPAISIANEIKAIVPHAEFLFVGAEGKMEMEKVPAAGYKIIGLWISGLQRKLTFSNLLFPFKVIASTIKARKIIQEFKPDIVIGTGGYASGPTLRAAVALGIPTLIQEQNSYPGITNKLLSKKVNLICVGYEGMEKFFPANKLKLTGNPVRQDLVQTESKKEEAYSLFNLSREKKTILVIGGSLGARTINQAINSALPQIIQNNLQLIWQTGKSYFDTAKQHNISSEVNGIKIFEFISRMDLAYAAADLIISRAGASSVSELALVGKPCILVPSPNVAEDHQTKNAHALVNKQAAVLVKDADAMKNLIPTAIDLMNNSTMCEALRQNISQLAFKNASRDIAHEILKLTGYKL